MAINTQRMYVLAIVLAVAAAAALAVDMAVARQVAADVIPGDMRKFFAVCEVFAHGTGVALILLTVAVLDPANRRRLLRVGICAYGAGFCAQLAKQIVPRVRPNAGDLSGTAWDTFLAGGPESYSTAHQLAGHALDSFPSGHSATAVGLAFGLAWLYPHGRWLFALFAILAMAQRVESSAHYVSDTLAGAALACLVAAWCWQRSGLDPILTRFESQGGQSPTAGTAGPDELRQAA